MRAEQPYVASGMPLLLAIACALFPITRVKAATASSESFMVRLLDPSMKPRLRPWRLGLLACLLAQDFFHKTLPSLYLF